MTGGEVVGLVVGGTVVSSSEEVVEDVSLVVSVVSVPPVDNETLCRLKRAMASSRASAEAAEANSIPARRKVSLRMVI